MFSRQRDKLLSARAFVIALLTVATVLVVPRPASAIDAGVAPDVSQAYDSFAFRPEADTYADSSSPANNYGSAPTLYVDGSPSKTAFLRFRISGISSRTILAAHLRMYATNGCLATSTSPTCGRVAVAGDAWSEGDLTSNNLPEVTSTELGRYASVSSNTWHTVRFATVDFLPTADGSSVSFAVVSANGDGVAWRARETQTPPVLVVDVARVPGTVLDGVSSVTSPYEGSSDPTYFASQHRMVVTRGGRILAVHGLHATGVQLAWRDPGGGWQTDTVGDVAQGLLLSGAGTGDWAASIALAPDSTGAEHAWVVWGGWSSASTKNITMRRLSDLDAPEGPTVGRKVVVSSTTTVDAVTYGNSRPDIAFERTASGTYRGCIVWLKRIPPTATSPATWDLKTTWFTDLDGDAPATGFTATTTLLKSSSGTRIATLTEAPSGLAVVMRNNSGRLEIRRHSNADGLSAAWTDARTASLTTGTSSFPSAVGLSSGDVLVAVENDTTNHVVSVVRFFASSASPQAYTFGGTLLKPSIASDGTRAWVVMADGVGEVVSSSFDPSATPQWSAPKVLIGAECSGNCSWPNALRQADGRLRFVVRGPLAPGKPSQSGVLAFQFPLSEL